MLLMQLESLTFPLTKINLLGDASYKFVPVQDVSIPVIPKGQRGLGLAQCIPRYHYAHNMRSILARTMRW